jgi:hypothetical protein
MCEAKNIKSIGQKQPKYPSATQWREILLYSCHGLLYRNKDEPGLDTSQEESHR